MEELGLEPSSPIPWYLGGREITARLQAFTDHHQQPPKEGTAVHSQHPQHIVITITLN